MDKDNVVDNTSEEKAKEWEEWVRKHLSKVLDVYLPYSKNCDFNIKYYPKKVEVLETGPVYDDTKAVGVLLSFSLEFTDEVDLTKPREE